ncbi:MAG: M48 family metallopeptidase [Opitutales bacterium]|nr:M48 family metallopeptidase [Opitutales bacterium]MCH8540918.1 M48 family metallopeptidase [Opitutales bacterium]
MNKAPILSRCFGFFLLAVLISGCHTVPETGRRAFTILSVQEEITLGSEAFAEIKKAENISSDQEKNAMLQRVGERIARVAEVDMPQAEWEFVLFENDAVNAFALPGGRIGFYTGMWKVAENEEDIAVIMGHEIAHVTARHGAERLSQSLAIMAVGIGVQQAVRDRSKETQMAVMLAYGAGTTLGLQLPHSRRNESEADEIGLYYMARAGYDPRVAPTFWEKMEAHAGGGSPPEFLSTHPSHGRRVQDLERAMPRALDYYRAAGGAVD